MNWKSINITYLLLCILLQGCGIYTLSGTSLPPEAKTFSVQFQSSTAQASIELSDDLEQQLSDMLIRRTVLKQTDVQGDLRFAGRITSVTWRTREYMNSDSDDETQNEQLTISVEVNYINPYNEKTSFDKKFFSESTVGDRSNETELITQVLSQLSQAIYSAALVNW